MRTDLRCGKWLHAERCSRAAEAQEGFGSDVSSFHPATLKLKSGKPVADRGPQGRGELGRALGSAPSPALLSGTGRLSSCPSPFPVSALLENTRFCRRRVLLCELSCCGGHNGFLGSSQGFAF